MDSVYEVRGDKLEISLSVVTPHFVRGVHVFAILTKYRKIFAIFETQ